jgi:hypothetical protein
MRKHMFLKKRISRLRNQIRGALHLSGRHPGRP